MCTCIIVQYKGQSRAGPFITSRSPFLPAGLFLDTVGWLPRRGSGMAQEERLRLDSIALREDGYRVRLPYQKRAAGF